MSDVFAVVALSDTAVLSDQRRSQVAFTVQNRSGRFMKGRARVLADDPSQQGWYAVHGEVEREFQTDQVHQFVVDVAVPADAPPGRATFRLEVNDVEPNGKFGQSGPVAVNVPAGAQPSKKFPWWIVAAAAGAAVVIGAVLFFVLRGPGEVEVPELVGMDYDDAEQALEELGLEIDTTLVWHFEEPGQTIAAQDPGAGTMLSSGGGVSLTVQTEPTEEEVLAEAERVAEEWVNAFFEPDADLAVSMVSFPLAITRPLSSGDVGKAEEEENLRRFLGFVGEMPAADKPVVTGVEALLISDVDELPGEIDWTPGDVRRFIRAMELDRDDIAVFADAETTDENQDYIVWLRRAEGRLLVSGFTDAN